MNFQTLAQDLLEFFQKVEPGTTAALKVGSAISVAGKTGITVLQKSKKLITWVVTQLKDEKPADQERGFAELEVITDTSQIVTKDNVAVVFDISRPIFRDVTRYLDENKIDCDLILITNRENYLSRSQFLDKSKSEEWVGFVRECDTAFEAIKFAVGSAKLHVFLSIPLPAAFGLGSVRGTVDESATIYHWQDNTYHPVLPITRALRQ